MRILLLPLLTVLCACSTTGSTSGSGHPSAAPPAAAPSARVAVVFSAEEIRIIRAYYDANGHSGKRKYKSLPPGIAKNLKRGKPLPPGIAKRALPYGLASKLPPPPAGYDRFVVAGKILLIELGTQVVRDILTDIAFG